MILELHLCCPRGEGERQEYDRALALLQLDNQYLIEAMLRAGRDVPDTVEELDIPYVPPPMLSDRIRFRGLRAMLEHGSFSCQEAAAWEAAVLVTKYGAPATAYSTPTVPPELRAGQPDGDGWWHAVYRTPRGVVDPCLRFVLGARQQPWRFGT